MSIIGDALSKGKTFIDGLLVPRFRKKSEEAVSRGDLWAGQITNSMLKKAYEKNGITRKLVNKTTSDTFDNWFEIESENRQLAEDVDSLFSSKSAWHYDDGKVHLGMKKTLKEAYKVGMVEGYALIALGFSDDKELHEEVEKPESLEYVSILTPADVKKLVLDEDENSETYGEIIGAEIKIGKGNTKTIHASRFIHLPVNTYGNSYQGIGYVKPAYNYLTVLDNVIWSTGQAFYRYACGFPHIKKKNATPNELEQLRKDWKEVNALTGWASDDGTEIEFAGARAVALDPEKYWTVALKAVAMSFDIPIQIVEGVAAGAVTGSETNLADYYSDISSKQEIEWTPIIEQLIVIAQSTSQVAKGGFQIKWKPLFEMDEKEMAEIEKIRAETKKILVEAGIADPEQLKKELEKQAKTDAPEFGFRYDGRTNLQAKDVESMTEAYSAGLQRLFSIEGLMKAIKNSELEGIIADEFSDLDKELELIDKAREKKVKETVDKYVGTAWEHGKNKAEEMLSMNIVSSEKAAQVKKIILQSNYTFANSLGKDATKKTLFEVQQSILAGEGYPQMRKKIKIIVDAAKHNADTIARTETVRTISESIKQSYRDSGIVQKVQWVTAADEAVCQECGPLDGQTFELGNVPPQPLHPNCRCTLTAYFGK